MELLTYETVEAAVKKRVDMKVRTYGQELKIDQAGVVADPDPVYKIKPSLVANLYGDWIMPLTKEVQVEYLLRRLDWSEDNRILLPSLDTDQGGRNHTIYEHQYLLSG